MASLKELIWRNGILSLFFVLTCLGGVFVSCSDDDGDPSEYYDWKSRNDAYFSQIRSLALDTIKIARRNYGDNWENHCNWRSYLCYKLDENSEHEATDSIYVQILKRGQGVETPMSSDSARVFFRGRLIPSESYPDGLVFTHSGQSSVYADIFNRATSVPSIRKVSSFVKGFATALLYMHVGDRWRVYIPYQLAYKDSSNESIPAYSNLIYEIELVAFYRNGSSVPAWK